MITKIVVRPYKGTDQWEADVFMLINGKEVRRRWRSPMPSKLATERWAREKAKGFLADYGKPARPAPAPTLVKRAPKAATAKTAAVATATPKKRGKKPLPAPPVKAAAKVKRPTKAAAAKGKTKKVGLRMEP